MYGYGGNILRVDLTTSKVIKQPLSLNLIHKFIGGMGLNDWLLWEHFLQVDPRSDPLSEDNVLIAGLGPLGGTGIGLGAKMKFTFKSPLTGMFGDTSVGGTLGSNLRWAGYDHLMVTGRAKKPVYLWIDDDNIEIRDAEHLWGKGVHEATKMILEEVGDVTAAVGCIGPGGENLVSYACIIVTYERAAGRTGSGCVAGSKNLKAIAARGTKGLKVYDPEGFFEVADKFRRIVDKVEGDNLKKSGTLGVTDLYEQLGDLAYRNNMFSSVPPERLRNLKPAWFNENIKTGDHACSPGCRTACGSWCEIKGNETPIAQKYAGTITEGPELYASITFGTGCDISDFPAITDLNNLCNKYGLDGIEIGGLIPYLMELWERGIITERETKKWYGKPLSFDWGNLESVEKTIESVGLQDNELGRLLKKGIIHAGKEIERLTELPALKYALYGKGGVTLHKDARVFPLWGLNFAVASRGSDHLKGVTFLDKAFREDLSTAWLGDPGAGKPYVPDLKGKAVAYAESRAAVVNILGICIFRPTFDPVDISPDLLARAYQALTGIKMTGKELFTIGERVYNLEKAFNSRLGFKRADDTLCERWMREPVHEGPGKGNKAEDYHEKLLDEYYEFHGWDKKTSLQTRKKLEELDLAEVAQVLEKEKLLPA